MCAEARTAWMSLFNEDIAKVWSSEIDKLRNFAAVFHAFKTEFNNINKLIETEMDYYRKNITAKGPSEDATDSNVSVIFEKEETPTPNSDESFDVKADKFVTSPKITKNSKLLRNKKLKRSHLLQKENDVIDSSVIEITPDVSSAKKRKPIKYLQSKSKKVPLKNTTLTQMFGNEPPNCSHQTPAGDDTTYLDVPTNIELDDKRKPKVNISGGKNQNFANEPVRGKARKKLRGWSCKECQQFYEAMDLSETQLLEKINQCSRHRYKFKPPEETPAVVWEVDIPSSSDESESSILFNFKSK